MNNLITQDNKIRDLLDPIAKRHGYLKGVLDSETGRLTYNTYKYREFTTQEALIHVLFVNDIADALKDYDCIISTHLGEVIIRLPNEE